jgi:WD40 repeat protein
VLLSSPVCKVLAVSRNKKWIAIGDDRASIYIFDANQVLIKSFAIDGNGIVNSIVFSSDSKYLITAGQSSMIQVWDTENWTLFHQWDTHSIEITALQISGQFLASAGSDQVIQVWKLDG